MTSENIQQIIILSVQDPSEDLWVQGHTALEFKLVIHLTICHLIGPSFCPSAGLHLSDNVWPHVSQSATMSSRRNRQAAWQPAFLTGPVHWQLGPFRTTSHVTHCRHFLSTRSLAPLLAAFYALQFYYFKGMTPSQEDVCTCVLRECACALWCLHSHSSLLGMSQSIAMLVLWQRDNKKTLLVILILESAVTSTKLCFFWATMWLLPLFKSVPPPSHIQNQNHNRCGYKVTIVSKLIGKYYGRYFWKQLIIIISDVSLGSYVSAVSVAVVCNFDQGKKRDRKAVSRRERAERDVQGKEWQNEQKERKSDSSRDTKIQTQETEKDEGRRELGASQRGLK